jgi:hypothetical protein
MLGLLAFIFGGLALGALAVGMSDGFSAVSLALPAALAATFAVVFGLSRRAQRRSVRTFTLEGVERHDGTALPWTQLERVVHQVRIRSWAHDSKSLWRTELRFRGGEAAWLIPGRIANADEVFALVRSLPCEQVEQVVGRQ